MSEDKKDFPGLGVMIKWLGGNEDTVKALTGAIGKEIAKVELRPVERSDFDVADEIVLTFTDGTGLKLWDGGQSCCESRYMTCDDKGEFDRFIGAKFAGAEIVDGPSSDVGEYGDTHDIQFLNIKTSKGTIQCATHNEHNGYYGGFWIEAANV